MKRFWTNFAGASVGALALALSMPATASAQFGSSGGSSGGSSHGSLFSGHGSSGGGKHASLFAGHGSSGGSSHGSLFSGHGSSGGGKHAVAVLWPRLQRWLERRQQARFVVLRPRLQRRQLARVAVLGSRLQRRQLARVAVLAVTARAAAASTSLFSGHGSSGGSSHGSLFSGHGSSGGSSHGSLFSGHGSSGGGVQRRLRPADCSWDRTSLLRPRPHMCSRRTTLRRPSSQPTAGVAYLNVNVPEDAKVYLQDKLMTIGGTDRRFVTPQMQAGVEHLYTVKVEVVRNGQTVSKTAQAAVAAGQEVAVAVAFDVQNQQDAVASTALVAGR